MRHRAESGQAGFTLVETLVSLALLGMASALVVAGLSGTHRVWRHVENRAHGVETVEAAETILRHRVEIAVPGTRYDGGAPYADFAGLPSTMTFVAPPGDALGPGGPRRYTLWLAPSGALVLSNTSDTPHMPGPRHDDVLLHGAQSLELAYFGAAPPDNSPGWRSTWRQRPAPPQLVRIRVRFPPADRRWWPDLIIRPMADMDTDCALGPDGDRCRGR